MTLATLATRATLVIGILNQKKERVAKETATHSIIFKFLKAALLMTH